MEDLKHVFPQVKKLVSAEQGLAHYQRIIDRGEAHKLSLCELAWVNWQMECGMLTPAKGAWDGNYQGK